MYINGLPVVDATKPLEIDITDTDVAKGNSKDPASCAAAQAIKRKGYLEARVHLGRTYIKQGKKWLRFQTPQPIRSEIVAFDRGAMFATGSFVLRPPAPSSTVEGTKKRRDERRKEREKPEGNKKPPKKRTKMHRVYGVRQRGANV